MWKTNYLKQITIGFFLILLVYFSVLMLAISAQYFPVRKDVAFLKIKQWVFRTYEPGVSTFWFVAFYTHVITACFCLLAGFTQFFRRIIRTKWHRILGWIYVVTVLCFAGPSGLIMSFFANGGAFSKTAFLLLSVLWIFSTAMALLKAKQKKFTGHGAWMLISYALTLSALTLRAWKWGIVNLTDMHLNPMDLYRIIAWLGWVPNLIVALVLIRFKAHRKLLNPTRELKKFPASA
jgi:uncharacterized membrane protein